MTDIYEVDEDGDVYQTGAVTVYEPYYVRPGGLLEQFQKNAQAAGDDEVKSAKALVDLLR